MKNLLIKSLAIIVLLGVSMAQADLQCQNKEEVLKLTTPDIDVLKSFHLKTMPTLINVTQQGHKLFEISGEVSHMPTRVGHQYLYDLALDDVNFSISEFSHLVSDPGCLPISRVTCDYSFFSTYKGYLNFNGKSHELDCTVL